MGKLIQALLLILTFLFSTFTSGQAQQISGTVTDGQSGETLPGVNILVKGTSTGTSTDSDGHYGMNVASLQDTLVFSFVGYQTRSIPIDGRTEINVEMQSQAITGHEMVVVGYGVEQKANLTGSVSSVDAESIEKRTVSNSSQALAGVSSGLTVTQGSGAPGQDQASIRIRGLGTFSGAGNAPLVIIDGVPGDINNVNPNNIKSISVLKDAASASIYGSRAANGVILISTKEGKKRGVQVDYNFYIGKQKAAELPRKVNSWTYAKMWNEARANVGKGAVYSQEEIEKYRSGKYPGEYPNKNHLEDLFTSGNGFETKHNLSISGGKGETQYLFSAGYLKQNGLIEQVNYDRYNLRLNLNSKLTDNLKLNTKIYGYESNHHEPGQIDEGSIGDLSTVRRYANSAKPIVPGKKSDGTYGTTLGHLTPAGALASDSFGETTNSFYEINPSLEWDIINSLTLTGRAVYSKSFSKGKSFAAEFEADPEHIFSPSMLQVSSSENNDLNLIFLVNYDRTFGNHGLHVLGGFSQEVNNYSSLGGYRDNFPSVQLHELNAGSAANDQNSGTGSTWSLRSYFGRIKYAFKSKYRLEGNIRYDGSSRFSKGNRYGVFPSVSAAWTISEENFFQIPWVETLKIRSSYGVLGNQQIGTYPYQRTLNLGQSYPIGIKKAIKPGIQLQTLPSRDISWESTNVFDVGVDISLFNSKLSFTADYYNKKTHDILYHLTVSDVLGKSVGRQNAGKVGNKGFDFELRYQNQTGDFSYSIRPNFSVNHNEVLKLANVEKDIAQGLFVGYPLNSMYGYKTEGLFVDQEDIENYAEQNYNAEPGFPRYKDISGPDGKPDGKVSAEYDRTVIGNQFPKYTYGMGITAGYKGFDFYMLLQGQGGYQKQLNGLRLAFFNNATMEQWQVDERWTQENPDRNAGYPKLTPLGTLDNYPWGTNNSEYWLQNASFLRIKNIQVGYSIPPQILNNNFLNKVRVYISGQNIKSFNNYYPGYDPEMETGGYAQSSYYPLTRMWSFGVNVNF